MSVEMKNGLALEILQRDIIRN